MKKTLALMTCGAMAIALSGCGATGGSPSTPTQANVASNVLQFAAGTADYGAGCTSLNVVATYRQPSGGSHPGDSGSLLNSPTLTLPAALAGPAATAGAGYDATSTILSGPSTSEVGNDAMTNVPQSAVASTALTTFGQSAGVFALGIEPWNATGSGDNPPVATNAIGTPFQVPPYPVPVYDAGAATDANISIPWGGPPAFDYNGSPDSVVGLITVPSGTAGVSEGIDVFDGVAPVAGGAYSLSLSIPANTGTVTATKAFTMPATLTCIPQAATPAFTPDGTGGGTVAFTMPTGATEAFVQITDFGAVGAAATPVYYTLETTTSGTLTLPDAIGPGGAASTATGDQVVTQVYAFDYDAYGMSPLKSAGNPSPTILGANGSDDISVSPATCVVSGGGTCSALPLLKHRALQAARLVAR